MYKQLSALSKKMILKSYENYKDGEFEGKLGIRHPIQGLTRGNRIYLKAKRFKAISVTYHIKNFRHSKT